MKIVIAGATGLVGQAVMRAAGDRSYETIAIGRRSSALASHNIDVDFLRLPDLPAADVAICTLGTTIKKAGSKRAFKAVDYDAVMAFANAAKAAGIEHFIVVTAVGTNADSKVFYSSVKGLVERDLEALGFYRLDIVQPGLLIGERAEKRFVEEILQGAAPIIDFFMRGPWRRYASITAVQLSEILLNLAEQKAPGAFRHTQANWSRYVNNRKHLEKARSASTKAL